MDGDRKKLFQMIGGGLIVACAFAIMLPGLVSYIFGLWRIISLIVTMVIVAWLIVFIYHKMRPMPRPDKTSSNDETTNEEAED
ncbi:MAG: hypothetical protein AB7W16_16140 [Candidatus Obscuribacterales bacterium]